MNHSLAITLAGVLSVAASGATAEETEHRTIAALYQDKTELTGQRVRVEGTVVKVNNAIMGRNFLHLQDGTGRQGSTNDLTLTSQQTAEVGESVSVTGRVVVDRDFGYGYFYPLLLEEATIAVVE